MMEVPLRLLGSLLVLSLFGGCGDAPALQHVSVELSQPLTGFDSEDVVSVWVYEEARKSCTDLEAAAANLNENDSGYVTSAIKNAQTLNASEAVLAFELEDLPAESALVFLAKISDGSDNILTQGCNRSDPIGNGKHLNLTVVLAAP